MKKVATKRVSNAFMIGLFVIVSSIVLIGAVIWLGANKFFKENIYFVTYFDGSIEGLENGSAVKYQGVPVGSVSKIDLAPDGKLVQVTMQINGKIDLRDNMRVKLEWAGIAGGKFLQLHFPDTKDLLSKHPHLNFEPEFQVIPSVPSGLDQMGDLAKEIMENASEIDFGALSTDATTMIKGVDEFIRNKQLYETVESLNKGMATIAHLLERADSSAIISNTSAITDRLLSTSNQLLKFSQTMNSKIEEIEIANKLDFMVAKYDSLMTTLQTNINSLGFQSRTVLLTLNESLEQFKTTNKELRKTLRAFSDNPSQIFLSEPPEKEK